MRRERNARNRIEHSYLGAYGHEQRHVDNYIRGADLVATNLEAMIASVPCALLATCMLIAAEFQKGANVLMDIVKRDEYNHNITPTRTGPVASRDYEPRGWMPASSDCSPPGNPPKFVGSQTTCR